MGFRIREIQEKRKKTLALIEEEMIKKEAQRYGGSTSDPSESEQAFINKIKAIRSRFKDHEDVSLATDKFVKGLKNTNSEEGGLPISKIEPSLLLDLL